MVGKYHRPAWRRVDGEPGGWRQAPASRLVLLGEQHLRRAIEAYLTHDQVERAHQGVGRRLTGALTLVREPDGIEEVRLGGEPDG